MLEALEVDLGADSGCAGDGHPPVADRGRRDDDVDGEVAEIRNLGGPAGRRLGRGGERVGHVVKVGGMEAVGIANDFPLAGEQGLIEARNDNAVAVKNYYPWWDSMAKSGILGFDRKPQHVAVPELNNINRFQILHSALKKSGFKTAELEKILGGNWIRVLS